MEFAQENPRDGDLWRALADPSRRRILDLLRTGPLTTGQVAASFTTSRVAVMHHLSVLEEAGLVVSVKRGRQRWHHLNAVPLQRVHSRWVTPPEADWAGRLLGLETYLGDRGAAMAEGERSLDLDIAQELLLGASLAVVFRALTDEVGAWWGPPYLDQRATSLELEARLGGPLLESWPGGGRVLAVVSELDRPRVLELTGPFHFGIVFGVARFELSRAGKGTRLRFGYRAIGRVERERAAAYEEGWGKLLARNLTAFVERGERLGIAAGVSEGGSDERAR